MKLLRILILSLCLGYCYANLVMAFELPVVKQLEHWFAGQMDQQEIPWKLFLGVLIAGLIPFSCAFLYARSQKWIVTLTSVVFAIHFIGNRQSELWNLSGITAFFEPLTANSVSVTTALYLLLIVIWPGVYMGIIHRADKAFN